MIGSVIRKFTTQEFQVIKNAYKLNELFNRIRKNNILSQLIMIKLSVIILSEYQIRRLDNIVVGKIVYVTRWKVSCNL